MEEGSESGCHRGATEMLGLLAVNLCLVFLLLAALNPADDRFSREICRVFLSASHLVLALWAGYGLVVGGWAVVGMRTDTAPDGLA